MSISLEEIQQYVNKEAILHIVQDDGSLAEVVGTIKAATTVGVPYKAKGKGGLVLTTIDRIEEVTLAPTKAKSISQKVVGPVELGSARQHLADRHGISLKWCREATEQEALDYHESLDHADVGHKHLTAEQASAKIAKKAESIGNGEDAEREAALNA